MHDRLSERIASSWPESMSWRCRYNWACNAWFSLNIIPFCLVWFLWLCSIEAPFSVNGIYTVLARTTTIHTRRWICRCHVLVWSQHSITVIALNFLLWKLALTADTDTTRTMRACTGHKHKCRLGHGLTKLESGIASLFTSAIWLNLPHHMMWWVCVFDYSSYMWFSKLIIGLSRLSVIGKANTGFLPGKPFLVMHAATLAPTNQNHT
jgi:hypothetical protein